MGRAGLVVIAALVVGACATPSMATVAPLASAITSPAAPCLHLTETGEPLPPDLATMATISPFIAVATFEGTGASSWSSPNGGPPLSAREAGSLILSTAIELSVDTPIRGTADDARHAAIYGGSVGCSSSTYDDPLDLTAGARYLFFGTGPGRDGAGNPISLYPVFAAWSVTEGDVVHTALDGDVPLLAVLREIHTHPLGPSTFPLGANPSSS